MIQRVEDPKAAGAKSWQSTIASEGAVRLVHSKSSLFSAVRATFSSVPIGKRSSSAPRAEYEHHECFSWNARLGVIDKSWQSQAQANPSTGKAEWQGSPQGQEIPKKRI
jgi:hypothetical protein